MTDYYTELNIDRSLGIDEINRELSRLENTWKRRELNSPEKATKILALIIYARDVFKSAQTKSKYDRELAESKKPSESVDPDQQRAAGIEKWKSDADAYCDRGEYDLAKIAIDKALALAAGDPDDDLCNEAAVVYMEVGEYAAALNFINNAIVTNPENGLHYFVKAGIYGRNASVIKFKEPQKAAQYYNEERKTLQIGLNAADSAGDTFSKSRLLGGLAFSFYFEPDPDIVKAEELAREALALGDNTGNAQKVMDAVNEKRRAEEQAAREKKEAEERAARELEYKREQDRKEKIYQEALGIAANSSVSEKQSAIAQLETIVEYKDSKSRIESIKEAIRHIEEREAAARKKKRLLKKITLIAIPALAVAMAVTGIIYNINFHKCGDSLKWKYDKATSTLTVSGTGEMYTYVPENFTLRDWQRHRNWEKLTGEIENVVVADGVTSIGEYAFYGMPKLVSVKLPSSLLRIEKDAFNWSDSLTSIELPNNLQYIGSSCFWATQISEIYIPASVTEIVAGAFDGAESIKKFEIDPSNSNYESVDGVLFNKDMTNLIAYPLGNENTDYSIPEGVAEISNVAFRFARNLESIYVPETVSAFGWHAFEDCDNLVNINIPESITNLSEGCFQGIGAETFTVPGHVKEIGNSALAFSALQQIYITEGVESIEAYAFSYNYDLIETYIPHSVTNLDASAFNECNKLEHIYYNGTMEEWNILVHGGNGTWDSWEASGTAAVECTDGTWTGG